MIKIPIIVIVVIAIFFPIFWIVDSREYKKINKKIENYEKISKDEYIFWRKLYKGLTTYDNYENYIRICDLPSDKRDIFKGVDFSKNFKNTRKD